MPGACVRWPNRPWGQLRTLLPDDLDQVDDDDDDLPDLAAQQPKQGLLEAPEGTPEADEVVDFE